MDWTLIEQKLESLRRALTRIRAKCPSTAAALAGDIDAQDIVTLNLSRAVQGCVDIGAHMLSAREQTPPGTMGQTFDALEAQGVISRDLADRLRRAVGFRNIAIHSYETINWEIVHVIVSKHLSDFDEFAKVVMQLKQR
jgi:uncharacterized protein YutE (UPF0331/DUF86 family)